MTSKTGLRFTAKTGALPEECFALADFTLEQAQREKISFHARKDINSRVLNQRSTVSITEKQSISITLSYAGAHIMPPASNTETAENYISNHRDEISASIKYAKHKIIINSVTRQTTKVYFRELIS